MEPEPEPEPRPQPEPEPQSSSDSDDSDDFLSVQGDEQLMQDVEDDVDGSGSRSSSGSPDSALLPAVDRDLTTHAQVLEVDLKQQRQLEQDLDYRRRFLSLRPVFRNIYTRFSSGKNGVGTDADGGMEPSTMEGLAKTLFPRSVPYQLPESSAGASLVSWIEFTAFAEAAQHIPRDDAEWERLCAPFSSAAPFCCLHMSSYLQQHYHSSEFRNCLVRMEKLAMLHASADADCAQLDATSAVQPSSLAETAEAAAFASWTTEPGLREEHVEALACPSPRGRPPADGLGPPAPRTGAGIRPQSRSDLTADEIVGGSTRPVARDSQSPDAAEPADGDAGTTELQPDAVGRVESQVRKKVTRDLDRLVYCQRLAAHQGAVWAMRFSQDGRWLATGGQDTIVRIWRALMWNEGDSRSASPREVVQPRGQHGDEVPRKTSCSSPEPGDGRLDDSALAARRAFDPEPAFELCGHQHDVLDLAWSRDNFLLSSSMDATVSFYSLRSWMQRLMPQVNPPLCNRLTCGIQALLCV
jgi:hypothetical protein